MPQKKKTIKKVKEEKVDMAPQVIQMLTDIQSGMSSLTDVVKGLRERVIKLESVNDKILPEIPKEEGIDTPKMVEPKEELKRESVRQPIPEEYKMLVANMLGEEFGIQMEYFTDKPEFMFTIVVPKDYTDMDDKEYASRGADLRSKVISYAEGLNGVRAWCELVKGNLAKTAQSKIR